MLIQKKISTYCVVCTKQKIDSQIRARHGYYIAASVRENRTAYIGNTYMKPMVGLKQCSIGTYMNYEKKGMYFGNYCSILQNGIIIEKIESLNDVILSDFET